MHGNRCFLRRPLDNALRTKAFSDRESSPRIFREVIVQVQTENSSWPPSPRKVIDLLRERFRTDPSQLPVFYEAGDFDGETWADGELPASEFVEAVARQSGYTVKDLRNWADLASGLQELANQDARERVLRWLERQSRKDDGDFGPILSTPRQDWLRTFALAIELNKLDQLHNYLNRIRSVRQAAVDSNSYSWRAECS